MTMQLLNIKSRKRKNASFKEELAKFSSSISNVNDACATKSTSCEASILKENVELRAQIELITSKYGKLEEIHEKISSSNEDLLSSHTKLRLALEAITTKVTSSEPHLDNGTTLSKNSILPCASPSSSSTHNVRGGRRWHGGGARRRSRLGDRKSVV